MKRDFKDQSQRNAVCFRQWDDAHPEAPHKRSEGTAAIGAVLDDPACFQAHMGLWAMHLPTLYGKIRALQLGLLSLREQPLSLGAYAQAMTEDGHQYFYALSSQAERRDGALYSHIEDVALIRIVGAMQKTVPKFSGTSTILTRRAIRQALADEDISALMLAIDESPGGNVNGTYELAEEVRRASERKPIVAYIEDMGASAAYWVASQAQRITTNLHAQIGSIGVVAELIDTSGVADRMGIKVHVRSTGPYKGLGAPGTPVTPELLDEVDAIVQGIGSEFFRAVQRGRRLSAQRLEAVTTGQVWLAPKAQELGLIDGIETFEQAVEAAGKMRPRRRREHAEAQVSALAARFGVELRATYGQDGQEA